MAVLKEVVLVTASFKMETWRITVITHNVQIYEPFSNGLYM